MKNDITNSSASRQDESLEDAAKTHANNVHTIPEFHSFRLYTEQDFKAGAAWQKEKDSITINSLLEVLEEHISVLENERTMIGASLYKTPYYRSSYKKYKQLLQQIQNNKDIKDEEKA